MIPKVIHYCWFGGSPLTELAVKCIKSWRRYFPDYEIREWNESNFDVHICDYVKEAYKAKKWAFVSDYARFWILYYYGGVYFDTDVEVIKPMYGIVERGAFLGIEEASNDVAPGLGFAANPGLSFCKEVLEVYNKTHFINTDGFVNEQTVVKYATDILIQHGFVYSDSIQFVAGVYIYPPEYFCPQNYKTGIVTITKNTVSIHHYAASWFSSLEHTIALIQRCENGVNTVEYKLRRIFSIPFRIVNKIQKYGLKNTIRFIWKKLFVS